MKILDPDFLAPKQFSKMADSRDNFACVSDEFRFNLGYPYCMRLCSPTYAFARACVASENQALN